MSKIVVCNNCGHTWRTNAKRPQCNECKKVSVREATESEKYAYNHPQDNQDNQDPEPPAPQVETQPGEVEGEDPQPFEDQGEIFQPLPPGEIVEISPQEITSPQVEDLPAEVESEPPEVEGGFSWTKPLTVIVAGALILGGVYYLFKKRQDQDPSQDIPQDPDPNQCIGGYSTPGAFV